MGTTRDRFGGRSLANEGELATYTKWNKVGGIALQTMLHILAELTWHEPNGVPKTGFPGNDLLCEQGTGVLDIDVVPGCGFYHDTAATEEFGPHYQPMVLDATVTKTLDAHDATNPRFDIICVAPATEDDRSGLRNIKDVSTGAVSAQSVYTRRRLTLDIQVVKGTASATPAVPATPTGYVKISTISVPAVSGAVTITDERPRLSWGHKWTSDPSAPYAQNHVVDGVGNELLVVPDGATMDVAVLDGEARINGYRERYESDVITLTSHGSLTTYAIIYAKDDGTIAGMGSTGGYPSPLGNWIRLANFVIPAGTTAITAGMMTDMRTFYPIDTEHLEDGAVEERVIADAAVSGVKLSVVPVIPELTTAGGEPATVAVAMKDPDGNPVARVVRCWAQHYDDALADFSAPTIAETGTGSNVSTAYGRMLVFDTDANGEAELRIVTGSPTGTETVFLKVTPVNTPGSPTVISFAN